MNMTTSTNTIFLNGSVEHPEASTAAVFIPSEYFLSTHVRKLVETVLDFCISLTLSIAGIVSNILVIVVFSTQGFKDTVNISMTFIAFWDLTKCVAGAMQRMAGPVRLINEADAESWTNLTAIVSNYLLSFASYVSSVLAAFVAVERCLCVILPFKVKLIITPKVTFISCSLISVVIFGLFAFMWGIYDIVWVFHPGHNRSILMYRYNDFFHKHKVPLFEYYNLSGILWPIVSFVIISVCTVIIIFQLHKSSKFRSSGLNESGAKGESGLSKRDRQVVKMLLVIIIIYIVTLSPRIGLYVAKYFVYELYFIRLYHNLFTLITYIVAFFDILNSFVNLYIFLIMSSSFRSTFLALFSCLLSEKN